MSNKIASSLRTTFRSVIKYKNFRYFWIGQCVSLIGTWMQRTAQTWLVLQLTKSPLLVGLLGVAQFLPLFLFSLFAGVIADRFPKKKVMLMTQSLFTVQAVVMTALTFTGLIQYWHVLVLVFLYGVTQTFDMPARQAFFYDLVGKADIMNAISLNSTIVNLAKIIGPVISGAVLAAFGFSMCFLINAVSFLAVIAGLLMIRIETKPIAKVSKRMFTEVKAGLLYIKQSEELMIGVAIMTVVSIFVMNTDVIIPVYSESVYGDSAILYTSLMSAVGFGALLGAICMAYVSKYGLRKHYLLYSGITAAVLFIITFFFRQYFICLILLVPIGFCNLVFLNTANALFQVNTPDEYRGRVMSVYAFINQGSHPAGNFFAGTAMEYFGGASGFIICGSTMLLFLLPIFAWKRKTIRFWLSGKKQEIASS